MVMSGLDSLDTPGCRAFCEALWWEGVNAVKGEHAVSAYLAANASSPPDLTVAVGKAASSMCLGAYRHFDGQGQYVLATKYDHVDDELKAVDAVTIHECGHPIPDENSLKAGRDILDRILQLPVGARLLVLVSGGASSLVEVLNPGLTLSELEVLNLELIASGQSIEVINERRRALSMIKDGKLLEAFAGKQVDVLGISDVPQSDFATLGSGIGDTRRITESDARNCSSTMIGSNAVARQAVAQAASERQLPVIENLECLYDDVHTVAEACVARLIAGKAGVYVWGGEPTVVLPEEPGEGGRNQALGLLVARLIDAQDNLAVMVAGTDGTDGPTVAAGALVDGSSYRKGKGALRADACLQAADSGTFLDETGDRFVSGPTGTNVMDLVIAVKK